MFSKQKKILSLPIIGLSTYLLHSQLNSYVSYNDNNNINLNNNLQKKSTNNNKNILSNKEINKEFSIITTKIQDERTRELLKELKNEKKNKKGILFLNLGGPETIQDVEPFLYNLFNDPEIIRLPWYISFLQSLIAWYISHNRAPQSSHAYESIGGGSPINGYTISQALSLKEQLESEGRGDYNVYFAMRYWKPFSAEVLKQIKEDDIKELIIIPLYPHYSVTTTGSSLKDLYNTYLDSTSSSSKDSDIKVTVIPDWFNNKKYVKSIANLIYEELLSLDIVKNILNNKNKNNNDKVEILFSAHGVPQFYVTQNGDPYQNHIKNSKELILNELKSILKENNQEELISLISSDLSFQSRVGPVQWLRPYTDDIIKIFGEEDKIKNLIVVPISFVSEHVETLEEIDQEYQDLALTEGKIKEWRRVQTPNSDDYFIQALSELVKQGEEDFKKNTLVSIRDAVDNSLTFSNNYLKDRDEIGNQPVFPSGISIESLEKIKISSINNKK